MKLYLTTIITANMCLGTVLNNIHVILRPHQKMYAKRILTKHNVKIKFKLIYKEFVEKGYSIIFEDREVSA